MAEKVLLLTWNNYYNKVKRRPRTAEEYTAAGAVLYTEGDDDYGVNFYINDGVDTSQVCNCEAEDADAADYAVVCDFTTNDVLSRWFVTEAVKNTKGQYVITLHRDVIADNWEAVVSAQSMILKAPIYDKYNKLLFNREGNTYNRIKRSEHELTDATKTPWIVGYLTKPTTENPDSDPYYVIQYQPSISTDDQTAVNLSTADYNAITGLLGGTVKILYQTNIGSKIRDSRTIPEYDKHAFISNENALWYVSSRFTSGDYRVSVKNPSVTQKTLDQFWASYYSYHTSDYNTAISSLGTPSGTISVEDYENLVEKTANRVCVYNGVKYKISLARTGNLTSIVTETSNVNVYNYLYAFWSEARTALPDIVTVVYNDFQSSEGFGGKNIYNYVEEDVSVTMSIVSGGKIGVDIHKSHDQLDDAPWSMFAIPLFPIYAEWKSSTSQQNPDLHMTTTTQSAIMIARAIIERWGGNFLKDIQILPWCPMPQIIVEDHMDNSVKLDLSKLHRTSYGEEVSENAFRWSKVEELYQIDQDQTEHWRAVNIMLWCDTCTGETSLKGPTIDLPYGKTAEEYKILNETHIARIVSPNQNGIFEFTPASNYGVHAEEWRGRWTYKPFSPFVQVTPYWRENGLYGGTWKDTRGLICQGDFSMPQTSSAWETYAVNNKNYQAAFDRQIDNLQFTQRQERISAGLGIATGAVGGGIAATVAGVSKGGLTAGIVGGIAGTALSAASGIIDYNMLISRQQEAQSYQTDMFRMSLENIMAQPASINRVGAQDYSFRYFPILEIYTATEEEENALREQLHETGMTVGVIGKIEDYLIAGEQDYVQANIIRFAGLAADYHVATEIALEAARGMYMEGEY